MNVEIVAEAALFQEKEYINGIFVAVQWCVGWATCETIGMSRAKLEFSSFMKVSKYYRI